jgi:hypothetical protein
MTSQSKNRVTRRQLLQGAAAVAGGAAVSSLLPSVVSARTQGREAEARQATIGSVSKDQRLGIANISIPNGTAWLNSILHMHPASLAYQQQLTRSTALTYGTGAGGPGAAAYDNCGGSTDGEQNTRSVVRQIQVHESMFGRRNYSSSSAAFMNFLTHKNVNSGNWQIYYVGNEPEAAVGVNAASRCTSSQPFYRQDAIVDPNFALPGGLTFWEGAGGIERISARALAYTYLRLRNEGSGHVVLPPSAVRMRLGYGDIYNTDRQYWTDFYNYVHGVAGYALPAGSPAPITPSQLPALHGHHYGFAPGNQNASAANAVPAASTATPLRSAAYSANHLVRGSQWYAATYLGGVANQLPMDLLLSEMGPAWDLTSATLRNCSGASLGTPVYTHSDKPWTGGWGSLKDGASWWNSWLHWLLRAGPRECNLNGWAAGSNFNKVIHACIHSPDIPPFTARNAPTSAASQQVWYRNSGGAVALQTRSDLRSVATGGAATGQFRSDFLCQTRQFGAADWIVGPLGASYALWANKGHQLVSTNLASNWVQTQNAGTVGSGAVTLNLAAGYNTILVGFTKDVGNFAGNNVRFRMQLAGTATPSYFDMNEFGDTQSSEPVEWRIGAIPAPCTTPSFSLEVRQQVMPSSMVVPLLIYSDVAGSVSLTISRENPAGNTTKIWVSPPHVIPTASYWRNEKYL